MTMETLSAVAHVLPWQAIFCFIGGVVQAMF
jgi:hypothetical protein